MRHILAVLTVAATVALSATAAFASGDGVDYPGPGFPNNTIVPGAPSQGSTSFAVSGPAGSNMSWAFMRAENWGR